MKTSLAIKSLAALAAAPFIYLIGRESITTLSQLIQSFQAIESNPLGSSFNVDVLANQFELLVIQCLFIILIALPTYYLVRK
jgi:hypothetical protein